MKKINNIAESINYLTSYHPTFFNYSTKKIKKIVLNLWKENEDDVKEVTEVELAIAERESTTNVQLWKSYEDEFGIVLTAPDKEIATYIKRRISTDGSFQKSAPTRNTFPVKRR